SGQNIEEIGPPGNGPETNDLEWPCWPSMPVGTGYEAGLRGGARFSFRARRRARSPIVEFGDSTRLKSPISRPSRGTETVSIGGNVPPWLAASMLPGFCIPAV